MRCQIAKAVALFVPPVCCMQTVHMQGLEAEAAFKAVFQNVLHEFLNSNSALIEDTCIKLGIISDVNT